MGRLSRERRGQRIGHSSRRVSQVFASPNAAFVYGPRAAFEVGLDELLRRLPVAAEVNRHAPVQAVVDQQNAYLEAHTRAKTDTALKRVQAKLDTLRVTCWLSVRAEGRVLRLEVDEAALEAESRLGGCHVLETDVPQDAARAETIHSRYKDPSLVENAFRTSKTGRLSSCGRSMCATRTAPAATSLW
ncbi:MAG: hypothetical protein ACLFU6_10510 [Candidatus Hydrogenedentota bacterium]